MSGPRWCIICTCFIVLQLISPLMAQQGTNSTSCEDKEKFFNNQTITNPTNNSLLGVILQCTTSAVFEVRYTNKQLCTCGRYVGSKKDGIVVMSCRARLPLNFTVQISVEKVRNRWGENCTFHFLNVGARQFFDVQLMTILPGKIFTSQPSDRITLDTGNTVTPTPNPSIILQSAVPSIRQSPVPSVQPSSAFMQTSPSSSEVSTSSSVSSGEKGTNSTSCEDKETFFNNETIANPRNNSILTSFTLQCTIPTVFEVRYTNKQLCACGRDLGNKEKITSKRCQARLPLKFTVQISVEKVHNRWGENCTFYFSSVFMNNRYLDWHVLRILPGNFVTSQPSESVITLSTGNIVTSTPNPSIILQSTVPSIRQSPVPSIQTSSAFIQTSPSSSVVSPSSSVSPDSEKADACRPREKFFREFPITTNRRKSLQTFTIECTAQPTVFEVRYNNKQLCACGRITKVATEKYDMCIKKLPLNFTVVISTENIHSQRGDNCTFRFTFKDQFVLIAKLGILPGTFITSSYVIAKTVTRTSVVTRLFTSYITSTIILNGTVEIDQPSATSSAMVSQSEIGNSTTSSGQISSAVINPEHSEGSIPFYTGIVITPTRNPPILQSTVPSTQQSPVPSILQSSVLATPSLATEPTVLMTSSIKETPVPNTSTFIQASPTTSDVLPSSTVSASEKFKEDMDIINNLNTSTVNIADKKKIERILNAAANLINSNLTAEGENEDPGMQAVEALEDLGNSIARQLDLGNQSSFEEVTEDLVFGAAVIDTTTSQAFSFPSDESGATGHEKIDIPSSVFVSESGSDKAYFVGIIFKAYREMRNNTGGLTMGTKVINAIVTPSPSKNLDDPIKMTFEKINVGETFAQECSFWLENSTHSGQYGRWSINQCYKTFENQSHIKCECNHFTNFAVLFKISNDQDLSEEDTFRLTIITYVGLSLSILGCLLTFIIYVTLSNIKSDRAIIHTNLVLALGIADVIFLVTVAVKPTGDSCLAVAMLAFFFYLCVFFWMLVEGVYIYLMVIKVFRGNVARRRKFAYLVGWGCPIIIAVVTWAVLRNDVVSKFHCWLSVETGAIWAFVGPGLVIILINLIILLAVMRTTWATFVDDKEYGGLKSATKTFGAVIPILGITWVFGVMAFNESSLVFQYIFAITNSLQGALIFILYCIVNNEVRNELRRRITVWQTRREMSSSSAGRRTTYPYIVSSEKNTTFNRTTASAQETPDLHHYPLSDMKEVLPPGRMYTFEDPNITPKTDSESSVQEKEDHKEDHKEEEGDRVESNREEGDRKDGRSSPVELDKNSGDNDVCDDSVGQV